MSRTVLITGATGLIGREIVNALLSRGDNVIVVTTRISNTEKVFAGRLKKIVSWDGLHTLAGEKIDVIINLAGKNVGEKRWSDAVKKEIYSSRIESTLKIVELIKIMNHKPEVLVNASGTDYYGSRGDEVITEDSPAGMDFLSGVCIDWEKEAYNAEDYGVRTAVIRTGFVLAKNSPGIRKLLLPFKFFAGGTIGSGRQYVSWIHIEDITAVFLFAADNNSINGAVNGVSPAAVTMKELCKNIGKVLRRPSFFPVPSFIVKLIAGQMSQVVLSGRNAFPKKLISAGFKFRYNDIYKALNEITA